MHDDFYSLHHVLLSSASLYRDILLDDFHSEHTAPCVIPKLDRLLDIFHSIDSLSQQLPGEKDIEKDIDILLDNFHTEPAVPRHTRQGPRTSRSEGIIEKGFDFESNF